MLEFESGAFYNRARVGKDAMTVNFISRYREFVDFKALRGNQAKYAASLGWYASKLADVDFNSNLLFSYSKKDCSREIFLVGFSRLVALQSYYYCNIMQLFDIFFGNSRRDNVNITEDEIMYSEQDIDEDIFCLFADEDMKYFKSPELITSLIASRENKSLRSLRPKYNWIFFRGAAGQLNVLPAISEAHKMFLNKGLEDVSGWRIVNLDRKFADGRKSKKNKEAESGEVAKERLDDKVDNVQVSTKSEFEVQFDGDVGVEGGIDIISGSNTDDNTSPVESREVRKPTVMSEKDAIEELY